MQLAKQFCLVALFVVVGWLAGIGGKQLYQDWNQPKPIERRDFSAVLETHNAEVVLFATATCPYCTKARETLGELGITYRELDIDASSEADQAFKALGERGVPVLITRDRLVRGYQPEVYRELFAAGDTVGARARTGSLPQASASAP